MHVIMLGVVSADHANDIAGNGISRVVKQEDYGCQCDCATSKQRTSPPVENHYRNKETSKRASLHVKIDKAKNLIVHLQLLRAGAFSNRLRNT